jgi:hypothetical protein
VPFGTSKKDKLNKTIEVLSENQTKRPKQTANKKFGRRVHMGIRKLI